MRAQLNRVRSLPGFAAGVSIVLFSAIVRAGDLVVTAKVNAAGVGAALTDVCDDAGKIRVFKDLDDFVKNGAKLSVFAPGGVEFAFANLALLDPKPFSGDYVTKNRNTIASYGLQKTKLMATSADYVVQLALMPENTAAELALKAEKTEQKAAVDAQVAYLEAEITRITAMLPAVTP